MMDGTSPYISWTVVENGFKGRVYTRAMKLPSLQYPHNFTTTNGTLLLNSSSINGCTDAWDCRNRDFQDWLKEGNYYYAAYNGANQPDCSDHGGNNKWGLAVTRSTSPLSGYKPAPSPLVTTKLTDVCGTSYSVLNEVNGSIYMYYSFFEKFIRNDQDKNVNHVKRSKLEWTPF